MLMFFWSTALHCAGPRDELRCNLIRLQQYSMRGRDNTLTANGLEHQLQFHCMLGKTHTAYFELTTPTEALKSLQGSFSSLRLVTGLINTSGPKSPLTQVSQPPVLLIPIQQGFQLPPNGCCLWSTRSSTAKTSRCKKQKNLFLNSSQQI